MGRLKKLPGTVEGHPGNLGGSLVCQKCKVRKSTRDFTTVRRFSPYSDQWCKQCVTQYSRLRTYDVTPEQFDNMLAAQNGCCAICGTSTPKKGWNVDHSHSMGVVRGILCTPCNVGLGGFRDNSLFLQAAIQYLKK